MPFVALHNPQRDQICFKKMSSPASRDWSTLPPTALINVLRCLDWDDAFSRAALVCRASAEAAVEAQTDLAFSDLGDAMAGDFEWWLCHKGHRLTCLQIEYSCCTLEALPCPNLRHLELEGMMRTPLTAGFGFMLHLAAATSLTWVSFNLVTLSVSRQHDAFGVLGRLPNLKALTWSDVTIRYRQADEDSEPLPHPEPPASFLQRATGLTYLQTDWVLTPTTLQQFSCLSQLQELHLECLPSTNNAAGLAPLKVGEVALQVDGWSVDRACMTVARWLVGGTLQVAVGSRWVVVGVAHLSRRRLC
jgi:hypothetical protein